jgi:Lrp/AsnC family leucine-responsive transcriptional regulator
VFVEITLAQKVRADLQEGARCAAEHARGAGVPPDLGQLRLPGQGTPGRHVGIPHLLGSILQQMPVPAQSNSYVVMEEVKESFVIPVQRGKV